MSFGLVGQAVALFGVTNVDDIIVLAVFFGQTTNRSGALRVIVGQYLGFAGILAVAVLGALGAGLLPEAAIPYLGLLPLLLGLRAGWNAWRDHRASRDPDGKPEEGTRTQRRAGALTVAAVTFSNGGDNIGVYVPVFATTGPGGLITYTVVFLILVAAWCTAGWFFASRPLVARALARWGHIILPVVLVAIGLIILIEGRAFGL